VSVYSRIEEEMGAELDAAKAECERLRGLLAIARSALELAALDVLKGRIGQAFARGHLDALRRSDPDTTSRRGAQC
jgi:hypothetical protein